MLVGTLGLLGMTVTADPASSSRLALGADAALLALLLLRGTALMGLALLFHLGVILAVFSKMVHGAYRFAALLRAAADQGQG